MANRNFKDDSGSEYAHQQSAANDGLFATPALDDNYDNTNNSNTTDIDSNHHPPSYSQITLNRSARWALDTIRTMYNYLTSPSLPSINLNHVDTAQAPSANQWLSFSPQNLANFQIIPALPLHNNDTSNNYMVYQSSAPIEHNQTVYTDPHRPKTAHLSVNPRVQTLEIAIYHHHQPPIFRQQTIIATEGQSNATAPSQTRLSYYQQPSNETLFSNISDTTLTEEEQQNRRPSAGGECYSISEILGEQGLRAAAIATAPPNKSDSSIINRFAKEADRRPVPSLIKGDRKSSKWSRILRIVNLFRALALCTYGVYNVLSTWNLPIFNALGARPYFIGTLVFLCVDLILAFIQAFPRALWCCWDVDKSVQTRSFSIWSLVADHELMIDMLPILANLILRVYGFRLDQITIDYTTSDTSTLLFTLGISASRATINTSMLGIYASCLLFTILTHSLRISRMLILQRAAYILTILVWIKVTFVCFDLLANCFLLYEVIYIQGDRFFDLSTYAILVLSVFAVSPLVTSSTNVMLNLPLHYKYLRMQLCSLKLPTGEQGCSVRRSRVLRASARKTFNPLLFATAGTYAFYSTCALIFVASYLFGLSYEDLVRQVPNLFSGNGQRSSWTSWLTNGEDRQTVFRWMICINILLNYAVGAVFGCLYWSAEAIRAVFSSWSVRYLTGRL